MPGPSLLETKIELLGNGRRLRVARMGTGRPMVLLHGYPENLQVWNRLAPLLAGHFQVIAFDWPGMGYSEVWPGGATPRIMAGRLAALLDEWGIEQPTVVGMDMGGQPALAFAAEHADRIDRLVVMNSLVFGDLRTSWEIRLLRKFRFNRFALRHLARIVFRRAEATFLPHGLRLDAAIRRDFWIAFADPQVRRFISKMCAGYQGMLHQLPKLYRQIKCPTLILWAEHDKHFALVQAEQLQQSVPGSKLEVIADGTHWMVLDRAEEVARRIQRWCDSY